MPNHDRSSHDRRIMSENPGLYIAMKSAVIEKKEAPDNLKSSSTPLLHLNEIY